MAAAVVLGVALAALVLLVVLGLMLVRRPSAAPSAGDHPLVHDDLPAFHVRPPGTRGVPVPGDPAAPPVPLATGPALLAPPVARSETPRPEAPGWVAAPRRDPAGLYALALAVLALLLVAAVALVGLLSSDGATHAATRGAAPAIPAVPAAPSPGQPGAGALAGMSVPLSRNGATARLTFAPVVLERYPVGVTVTAPIVSVTTSGRSGLAHVQMPTFNCLTPTAPADPEAAGCAPSVTEYADLPTPALRVTRDGRGLLVAGRFPTYTRPNGSAPVYTGRVYGLRVAIRSVGRIDRRRGVADGVLTLGGETTRSTRTDQDVLRPGR